MRLKDKVAIIVGAGQTPGETIGNGRATAILFAREGAKLLLVDRDLGSARETERMIREEGGEATSVEGDIARLADCEAYAKACVDRYGRIDILHNNVGIGGGDAPGHKVSEEAWTRILDINLTGTFRSCKAVIPIMRQQRSGSVINISSVAAVCSTNITAYKTSKAGMNALSQDLAIASAKYGVRVNVIMPGLMDTPMAIEGISRARGIPAKTLRKERNKRVPLRNKMGSGWDIAYAALFLASDEAQFVTGVVLPVDGGQAARVG
jgi:NAD(P)-dependent dehydrogenase (short-subunit alcohol dehydrogenase family)